MSVYSFKVNLKPDEALEYLKNNMDSELIYEEVHEYQDIIKSYVLIFEKYYFRSKNRAALTVTINNFNGETEISSISAGSSEGMIFNFDWGAGDDFASGVKDLFEEFIIE
ncbi:MAG: DUF6054 family protein [Bacillota bacterium]|nr:DUF6054 family protein [Bacillota bacterium]